MYWPFENKNTMMGIVLILGSLIMLSRNINLGTLALGGLFIYLGIHLIRLDYKKKGRARKR